MQLTTRAGNGTLTSNSTYAGGLWNGNDHTWIYTGVIWNRGSSDETWTWRFTFDDNVKLTIDGNVVKDVALNPDIVYQNYTLTPGPHAIEIRFGDGWGNVGPASGLSGLTYDPLARGSTDLADYILLQDPGDGSLLTTDVGSSETTPTRAVVNVNEGTLRITTAQAGLWEGMVRSAWDTTTPNPGQSVQFTTRAGNGAYGSNTSYAGGLWNGDNHTWIYTGVIWNRGNSDETWTWRFTFDDNVMLTIDGNVVRNVALNPDIVYQNYTLTPGPHTIEIRFGDGYGNVGPVSGLGGLTYDSQARGSTDPADYILLQDPGDGSLLTLTVSDPLASQGPLAETEVNLADGTTLDLNGKTNKVAVLAGTGTVANGTLASGTVISPAGDDAVGTLALDGVSLATGVTYRLTVSGAESDCLAFTGTMDLSGLTIIPATATDYTVSTYLIATAAGGFTGEKPAVSGFPSKYKLIRHGTDLQLTSLGGTAIILK